MSLQELVDYYDNHPELQEEKQWMSDNIGEWRNEKISD